MTYQYAGLCLTINSVAGRADYSSHIPAAVRKRGLCYEL